MLLDDQASVKPFRPPAVETLTLRERSHLRDRLEGGVARWRWATELGLRVTALDQDAGSGAGDDRLVGWYARLQPVALWLHAEPAAAIVCLSVGAPLPRQLQSRLTAVDLAVLDLWARQALGALVTVLDESPVGEVARIDQHAGALWDDEEPMMRAKLTWAGERAAGVIAVGSRLARSPRETGPTLGDFPGVLAQAPVTLEARLDGPRLALADLLTLQCGDVVLLGKKTAVEVGFYTGDMIIARGRPGARGSRMAVRLTWTCEQSALPDEITDVGVEMPDGE